MQSAEVRDGSAPEKTPRRQVFRAEALSWLESRPAPRASSVVTSLPDVSELPNLGFVAWRDWFIEAARRVMLWVPRDGFSIFYQSDVRHHGAWVDKSYLILRAAEAAPATLLWHKIVCRKTIGTRTHGRASYSHLLCVSTQTGPMKTLPAADVLLDTAEHAFPKTTSHEACSVACQFLKDESSTRTVVDPFCGQGTVLAIANRAGFDAIGVEIGKRRCAVARKLSL